MLQPSEQVYAEKRTRAEHFSQRCDDQQRHREPEAHAHAVQQRSADRVLGRIGFRAAEDDAVDDDQWYEQPERFIERGHECFEQHLYDRHECRDNDDERRYADLGRYEVA